MDGVTPEDNLAGGVFQEIICGRTKGVGADAFPVAYAQNDQVHVPVRSFKGNGWSSVPGLKELRVNFALVGVGNGFNLRQYPLTLVVPGRKFGVQCQF